MLKITLTDVNPLIDGVYDLDDESFTNRELHIIKQVIGAPVPDLDPRDPDLFVAFAVLALRRAGKITSATPWACDESEALWEAQVGQIQPEVVGEGEPDPTPPVAEDGEKPRPDANGSSSSGSRSGSAPSPTGVPV